MRVSTESMIELVRLIRFFDVRLELFIESEEIRLLRMSITSDDTNQTDADRLPCVFDYEQFVFLKLHWTGDQVATLLEQIGNRQAFNIECYQSVVWDSTAREFQFDAQRVSSGQRYALRKRNNPFVLYQSTIDLENNAQYNAYQSLNGKGVPYLPTLQDAEAYYLFDIFLEGNSPLRQRIQIAIDDRRARFERIIVTNFGLRVSIVGDELFGCEIKLFGKRPGLIDVIPVLNEHEIEIPLQEIPAELSVYLSYESEILDQRFISDTPSVYAPTEGITVQRDDKTSIESILMLKGENLYIDYKREYTENILSTICAFANTEGGSIFVGITDEAEILGINESWDKLRLRVESALEARMCGHVRVDYIPHTISNQWEEEKIILEIKVASADDKPVCIRDGDKEKYYLRRDGTNKRIMKRDDWAYLVRSNR